MQKYRVFKRSAKNWEQFAYAKKIKVRDNLTYEEAQRMCSQWNDNRNSTQVRNGTKYEFESM